MNTNPFPLSRASQERRKSLVAAVIAVARCSGLHRTKIHPGRFADRYVPSSETSVTLRLEIKSVKPDALGELMGLLASADCEVTKTELNK